MEAAEMVSMLVLFSMMDVGRQRQMNANREVKVTLNPFGISSAVEVAAERALRWTRS